MSSYASYPEYLKLIDDRSAALRAAVAAAPDLDARVPGCPAWNLKDLVLHLGQVQRFWAVVVAAGEADAPPPRESIPGAMPAGDLLEWSAESTELLVTALASAGEDAPSWAWWPSAAAPRSSTAVARHQVAESGVHAWDAQDAIGRPAAVPEPVALDAVAEFLQVTYGAEGSWPELGAQIKFVADEGTSWVLDLSELGARVDPADSAGTVDATVRGPASDILLVLYGRIPLSRLTINGDAGLVGRLREWGDTD
jgi:uncharacterized protein (TIGR03083 family)